MVLCFFIYRSGSYDNKVMNISEIIIETDILKLNVIFPIDLSATEIARKYEHVIFIEEGILSGGIGEQFGRCINSNSFVIKAINDNHIPQATVARQLEMYGLDSNSIYKFSSSLKTSVT